MTLELERSWSAEGEKCIKRARSNAADNSWNADCFKRGTFDLARREMVIEPSISSTKITAAKAAVDASENP